MKNASSRGGLERTATLSIFAAIIVVLTVLCTFVRFGPFSITLALTPIIIGAALYGKSAGGLLGGIFGFVVLLTGIFGWDGGTIMLLMSQNAFACIVICIGKGALAGFGAGLLYEFLAKKSIRAGVISSAIATPLINTGLFVLGMLVFYTATLESWASGQGVLYFIIFGLTGVNFIIELVVNLVLVSGITAIIRYGKRSK